MFYLPSDEAKDFDLIQLKTLALEKILANEYVTEAFKSGHAILTDHLNSCRNVRTMLRFMMGDFPESDLQFDIVARKKISFVACDLLGFILSDVKKYTRDSQAEIFLVTEIVSHEFIPDIYWTYFLRCFLGIYTRKHSCILGNSFMFHFLMNNIHSSAVFYALSEHLLCTYDLTNREHVTELQKNLFSIISNPSNCLESLWHLQQIIKSLHGVCKTVTRSIWGPEVYIQMSKYIYCECDPGKTIITCELFLSIIHLQYDKDCCQMYPLRRFNDSTCEMIQNPYLMEQYISSSILNALALILENSLSYLRASGYAMKMPKILSFLLLFCTKCTVKEIIQRKIIFMLIKACYIQSEGCLTVDAPFEIIRSLSTRQSIIEVQYTRYHLLNYFLKTGLGVATRPPSSFLNSHVTLNFITSLSAWGINACVFTEMNPIVNCWAFVSELLVNGRAL